jgi:bifunctional non-homologous end joining protein LigD
MSPLGEYRKKREFRKTPEPQGGQARDGKNTFVVQRHAARRLHFDFRLAIDGVLKSWAVPKGPPTTPGEKRLAVHVEDHPLDYANFEGEIPKGNYGAGDVRIWDRGHFEVLGPPDAMAQIERGDFKFRLEGEKLHGPYVLVKMRRSERGNEWLLIKKPETADAKHPAPQARTEKGSGASWKDPAALPGAVVARIPSQIQVALATLEKALFRSGLAFRD